MISLTVSCSADLCSLEQCESMHSENLDDYLAVAARVLDAVLLPLYWMGRMRGDISFDEGWMDDGTDVSWATCICGVFITGLKCINPKEGSSMRLQHVCDFFGTY